MSSSVLKNEAAWLKEKQSPIVVGPADVHTPGVGELLVKVEAAAFHPLDAKLQQIDFFGLPKYPAVFGASLGGSIVAVGADVAGFAVGDKIVASNPTYFAPYNANGERYGAFQRYAITLARNSAKLDESTGYKLLEAITIPTQATVAALALGVAAALPGRPAHQAPGKKETVLIWGAGSAVGGYAVQYAAQAGYSVVATASAGDHARVKQLGATHVYDYRADEAQLVEGLKAHAPYAVILDAIGQASSLKIEFQLFDAAKGEIGTIYSMVPDSQKLAPQHVKVSYQAYAGSGFNYAANGDFIDFLWKDWLTRGLREKTICPQKAHIVVGGLDKVQECLDTVPRSKGAQVVLQLVD
ncbi:GroES-like protein [Auricularia subglabra TFB-10046 SS5]|nr:GroES-like protein [Auricularia subglabra TFB-10046 SS5]